jgi:hypothetical protein
MGKDSKITNLLELIKKINKNNLNFNMQTTFTESIKPNDNLKNDIEKLFAKTIGLLDNLETKRVAAKNLSQHLNPTIGQKITPLLVNFSKIRDKSIVATDNSTSDPSADAKNTECKKHSKIETVGDGNCLFYAVLNSLEKKTRENVEDIIKTDSSPIENSKWYKLYNKIHPTNAAIKADVVSQMRMQAGEWYKNNLNKTYLSQPLSEHIASERNDTQNFDIDKYIDNFKTEDSIWGDNSTVWALAQLYDLRIIVCDEEKMKDNDYVGDDFVLDTDYVFDDATKEEYKKDGDPIYIHFERKTDGHGKSSAHYSGMVLNN